MATKPGVEYANTGKMIGILIKMSTCNDCKSGVSCYVARLGFIGVSGKAML